MDYETSAPRKGQYVLAGWADGGSGLKFFKTPDEALEWLTDPRRPYEQVPGRRVFLIKFEDAIEQKVVFPPPPCFEEL